MKELIIIVEGQTEEEFVNKCLIPFFKSYGIDEVKPILLETSPNHGGGDMSFKRYKTNIDNLLHKQTDILVTSLIDFFRINKDFPGYKHAMSLKDKNAAVAHLEQETARSIDNENFLPYIQLHEFEGLLFSDNRGFIFFFNESSDIMASIKQIIDSFPNPEMINDGPNTAPSKRLINLIPRYRKVYHGSEIASENGIQSILDKCPRFSNWIENIKIKFINNATS